MPEETASDFHYAVTAFPKFRYVLDNEYETGWQNVENCVSS